jgi:ribose 5-phosphate isomerase A
MTDLEALKREAARRAVAEIKDGMTVGLGTGSTATHAVDLLGERVRDEGLRVLGVPTSERTAAQARALHIPLSTLEETPHLDLAFDGADEIQRGSLDLIKGAGGALLREKLVEVSAARLLIIADHTKLVDQLGERFAVPVEVVRFGWKATAARLAALGCQPALRLRDGQPWLTDEQHYLLDCRFDPIADPRALADRLKGLCGVVEHGLFIQMAQLAFVASPDGVQTLRPTS